MKVRKCTFDMKVVYGTIYQKPNKIQELIFKSITGSGAEPLRRTGTESKKKLDKKPKKLIYRVKFTFFRDRFFSSLIHGVFTIFRVTLSYFV